MSVRVPSAPSASEAPDYLKRIEELSGSRVAARGKGAGTGSGAWRVLASALSVVGCVLLLVSWAVAAYPESELASLLVTLADAMAQ